MKILNILTTVKYKLIGSREEILSEFNKLKQYMISEEFIVDDSKIDSLLLSATKTYGGIGSQEYLWEGILEI